MCATRWHSLFSAFGSFFIAHGLLQAGVGAILFGVITLLVAIVFQGGIALKLAIYAGIFAEPRKVTRLRQVPFARILGLGILVNLIPIIAGFCLTESRLIEVFLVASGC